MNANKLADALRDVLPYAERDGCPNVFLDAATEALAEHEADPQANKTFIVNMAQAAAWRAVADALTEVAPGWLRGDGTGMECAVAAIKRLAQPAQAAQPVDVPDGWLMVPKHDVTSDMIRVGMEWITNCQTDFDRACMVTCIFGEMCKAAPQPTAQPSADAEDGFTEWLDKDWPLWITNPDNPNVARLRRAWIAARAAEGDGNGK